MTHEPLMIFGASTRAAAQSAVRAGFRPLCADHFADEDLYELAEVLPLARYPQGLIEAAASGPPLPWMYTGAIENHPGLLKRLAALRPLYGNRADVVTRARNPFGVARVLASAKLGALQLRPGDQPPPRDGRWLRKPRRGAGGRKIQIWDQSVELSAGRREPCYFQQRARGEPHSALYLATSAQTVLIGVSRQLIGESRLSAGPFAYCGSIGPVALGESLQRQIVSCGRVIGSEFGLRGLFGIDFMVDEAVAWLTEVNPRYTASVEVFESALGISLLGDHVRASAEFDDAVRSQVIAEQLQGRLDTARRSSGGRKCGKAVIYAPFTLRAPGLADFGNFEPISARRARIADRPRPGTVIPGRAPLCTLLVDDLKWPLNLPGSPLAAFEPGLSALLARLEPNADS